MKLGESVTDGSEAWFRLRRYAGWVAGVVGLILALIAGFDLIKLFFSSQDQIGRVAAIYFGAVSLIVILALCVYAYFTIHKVKYANITTNAHKISHLIRDIETYMQNAKPKEGATPGEHEKYIVETRKMFQAVLDQLARIFLILTSTHCRTTIKLIYPVGDEPYFYTLTRDSGSRDACHEMDQWRVRQNHDPLSKNSEFVRMTGNKGTSWYFISNNLPRHHGFSTTSMTAYQPNYGEQVADGGVLHRIFHRRWPLPYRSTMACAIRRGEFPDLKGIEPLTLGFLTVDSESRGVFTERWDREILFAVADALFYPLIRFIAAQNEARERGVNLA